MDEKVERELGKGTELSIGEKLKMTKEEEEGMLGNFIDVVCIPAFLECEVGVLIASHLFFPRLHWCL